MKPSKVCDISRLSGSFGNKHKTCLQAAYSGVSAIGYKAAGSTARGRNILKDISRSYTRVRTRTCGKTGLADWTGL